MEQATALTQDERVAEAIARLDDGNFDQAPVVDDHRPVGFVLTRFVRDRATSTIREVMTPLGQGNIVSADAPVGSLLDWIVEPGFLFVVDGLAVTGFITVSDFNKQPVRGYLYLQLASLETNLAELARRLHGERQDGLLAYLSGNARSQVLRRQQRDRRDGLDTDLIAYLDFGHLLTLSRTDASFISALGDGLSSDVNQIQSQLEELRRRVMHPVRGLVSDKGGLTALRDVENAISRLSSRVVHVLWSMSDPTAAPGSA